MSTLSDGGYGVHFLSLLCILFIGLKLTGHITWSWFWVLSPILVPLMLIGGIFIWAFIMVWKDR